MNRSCSTYRVVVISALAFSVRAEAVVITDPSFFDGMNAITIGFETFPGSGDIIPHNTLLTDQYSTLGVLFSSEDEPSAFETTDPGDVAGRFEAPWRILAAVGGGGAPTSGLRYASGDAFLGLQTSDLRIDFLTPVDAFGFFLIDNDFTDVRIRAFDAAGGLLEMLIAPQVSEGGVSYQGISVPTISYVIIDGNRGVSLNSSFIDELSFTPIPAPGALGLFVVAGVVHHRRRRGSTGVSAAPRTS